ncbi:MAG: hypothetical protein ACK4FF_07930 [Limnobacter sp.]|uniref:hypothetical protein n=1 Tax=Limnobacter sp. TaxID=2003368 RepID=UPI00391DCB80
MITRTVSTLALLMVTMGTAHAFGTPNGDGTYLPPTNLKSNLTRAEVLAQVPADRGFQGDATVVTFEAPLSKASRQEMQAKMDQYEYVGVGDGTVITPWVRKSDNSSFAKSAR